MNIRRVISNNISKKRAFDLTIGTVGLALSPLVIIPFGLALKLESLPKSKSIFSLNLESLKEPIFFTQKRQGQHGKPFKIYKLRTLRSDPNNSEYNHSRETSVGNFLRKYSLDEVPQFLNVCLGNMSVVGYRPRRPELAEAIPHESVILKFKPGLTGPFQIAHGEGEAISKHMQKMKERDAENFKRLIETKYAEINLSHGFSLREDFGYVADTVKLIFRGKADRSKESSDEVSTQAANDKNIDSSSTSPLNLKITSGDDLTAFNFLRNHRKTRTLRI